ncbi:MAG TPA: asparagine synthase B, partial [Steroidobacteraceae bacterium]|nr:asparagine synthase B [Steroidobacteraceae bacterium]
MCGIYGIYQLDADAAPRELLARMGAATLHRGPDDEGVYADGRCALGMRRLSIIDLEGGHQPLSSADERIWLVCNGEIYNYRALRQALEPKGYRFKTQTDCEVLIALYQEYGDDFVRHLNGMFAFALWDVRRQRLLLGRDRLG